MRKIHIHQNYQEDTTANDIALIELQDKIVYSKKVYPVCVDWDNTLLKPNTTGHVSVTTSNSTCHQSLHGTHGHNFPNFRSKLQVANYIVNETLGIAKHSFYIPPEFELFFESNMVLSYIPQSSCVSTGPAQELRKSYIGEDEFCVKRQSKCSAYEEA